jgi:RNA ligase (TIGR02306 family)
MQIQKPGMAWLGRVLETTPIEGADKIQRADVVCGPGGRWAGVVSKEIAAGEPVVVFLPDSVVAPHPATQFMEKHQWRVKMMRLRGCPSEVLIVPAAAMAVSGDVGLDLTEHLGVLKYEKEVPACISGDAEGPFPSFIPKTDELNFQTAPHLVAALEGREYYAAVKYDGTSQTFYHRDGEFGGCSRNWRLKEKDTTAVWELANRHNLKQLLSEYGNIALQWECVGPGIQGNPLKLTKIEARLFDAYDIDAGEYLDLTALKAVSRVTGIPVVDIAEYGSFHFEGDDWLRGIAAGNYRESGKTREGLVFRPVTPARINGDRLSFKVINLEYKDS